MSFGNFNVHWCLHLLHTGGGIRTTTFAILFLLIISKVFGRPNVRAFKRQVDSDTVKMSTIVSTISVVLVGFVSLVVMSSFDNFSGLVPRSQYNATHIFFEVFSAFGTSGLTTGITSSLNVGSKIVLSVLMFIGQFGVSSSVLIWTSKKNYAYKYNYISESVTNWIKECVMNDINIDKLERFASYSRNKKFLYTVYFIGLLAFLYIVSVIIALRCIP